MCILHSTIHVQRSYLQTMKIPLPSLFRMNSPYFTVCDCQALVFIKNAISLTVISCKL